MDEAPCADDNPYFRVFGEGVDEAPCAHSMLGASVLPRPAPPAAPLVRARAVWDVVGGVVAPVLPVAWLFVLLLAGAPISFI